MKKPRALSIIFTSIACAIGLGGMASAQNVPQGCFARTYDAAHLAAHPAQVVEWITIEFIPYGDGSGGTAANLRTRMAQQGHARASGAGGVVMTQIAGNFIAPLSFHVDGDGGSFDVVRNDGNSSILISTSGFFLSPTGEFQHEPSSTLAERAGAATRYLLHAAPAQTCR